MRLNSTIPLYITAFGVSNGIGMKTEDKGNNLLILRIKLLFTGISTAISNK
jgi:hypothetical protein